MSTKTEVELKEKQARYLERVEQLDNRIARLKTKNKGISERTRKRRNETKLKILVGALMMKHWSEKGTLEGSMNRLFKVHSESLSEPDKEFLRSMGVDPGIEEEKPNS